MLPFAWQAACRLKKKTTGGQTVLLTVQTTKRFIYGLITLSLFLGTPSLGLARDTDESELLLKEAMMQSNADWNQHQKKLNHEEFDRADQWEERNSQAIVIDHRTIDYIGYQQAKEEFRQNREVSSHQLGENTEPMTD
jgi:hypothetical protein